MHLNPPECPSQSLSIKHSSDQLIHDFVLWLRGLGLTLLMLSHFIKAMFLQEL